MGQGYKDTEFNKDTGRRTEIRDADYRIRGDVDVLGDLTQNGEAVGGGGGGSVTLETPTGAVNGTNDDFVFSAPPIAVFRNGVMESRLGSVSVNTFTFDTPPETGDDIEGLV